MTNEKENENLERQDFREGAMGTLTEKERLGVMYFAGINALKEKIEDNTKLLYKIATLKEDNAIFATLFFLFVILTGNDNEVKNTLLKCKEEEFNDKKMGKDAINNYIDEFNSRIKILAQKYMDLNNEIKEDLEFQKKLINEYSTYLMDELNIEKNDESYSELESIFLSALKIAFNFRDAENFVKDAKNENVALEENKEADDKKAK